MQNGNVNVDVAASQTDSALVTGVAGRRVVVTAIGMMAGATATTLIFNSKGSSSGTAISPTFNNGVRTPYALPPNQEGWFQTEVGEDLTCNTGSGSTTGISLTYRVQ